MNIDSERKPFITWLLWFFALIDTTLNLFPLTRCLPYLLGAVLHLQYHGRHLCKIGSGLPTRSDCLHIDHLARLHE